uniref:Uncharacterized protein n=1 Tax=Clostridioides difficile TaxID=1496 RepID=A0A0M4HH95_CLODI|nr:hypothetical protein [Clostridioides difficile]
MACGAKNAMTACRQWEEMLCQRASLRALPVPPLSNRGHYFTKNKQKTIQSQSCE